MDESLASEIRVRDRERWLSILWAPVAARAAMVALHAYDLEQQRVVMEANDPLLAEIKLAWWREQLDGIAKGGPVPGQPVLRALAAEVAPRGVQLPLLTLMEEGFLPLLLEGELDVGALARARGVPLFNALAEVIVGRPLRDNGEQEEAAVAGTIWAYGQLLRGPWGQAGERLRRMQVVAPPALQPSHLPPALAGLVALAHEDWQRVAAGKSLAPAGGMGRQWRFFRAARAGRR